jgi:hypothetical protein
MATPPSPASPDDIMKVAGIKALLKQVKSEDGKEISCAVGLPDGDKSEAVILLDKIMAPKGVRKHLLKEAGAVSLKLDEKSIRYGRATMDPNDESVLLIKVNREPSGEALAKAVRRRVRSIFKEVVFSIDPQLEGEAEDDDATGIAPGGTSGETPGGIPQGIVAKRAFLVERWRKIPAELRVQIADLNARIAHRLPHEDADGFCGRVTVWFDTIVAELQPGLDAAVDEAINKGDGKYQAVAAALTACRNRLATDELLVVMKQSDLLEGNAIEAAFTHAFDEIGTALTA